MVSWTIWLLDVNHSMDHPKEVQYKLLPVDPQLGAYITAHTPNAALGPSKWGGMGWCMCTTCEKRSLKEKRDLKKKGM